MCSSDLGRLTPLDIPVSGFRLHPVVACTATRPAFRPADDEVARILEVPLAHLLAPGTAGTTTMTRRGQTLDVPVFSVDQALVWGATAMVLAECLALLGWQGRRDGPPLHTDSRLRPKRS